MKIEICGDTMIVLVVASIAIAAAFGIVGFHVANSKAKVECFKTQQAAIAASSPRQLQVCE